MPLGKIYTSWEPTLCLISAFLLCTHLHVVFVGTIRKNCRVENKNKNKNKQKTFPSFSALTMIGYTTKKSGPKTGAFLHIRHKL